MRLFPRCCRVADPRTTRLSGNLPENRRYVGLALGIVVLNPELKMPAMTSTLTVLARCGKALCSRSCSYHRLWCGIWLPRTDLFRYYAKLLANETDARFIGYGAMLMDPSWRLWRWLQRPSSNRVFTCDEHPACWPWHHHA